MIDLNKIHRGMTVMTSDGQRLGSVRELFGHLMLLDDVASPAGCGDVSIPLGWILAVDDAVRLAKSRDQVQLEWQARPQATL